uniref:Arginine/serine-rich protein 45 n=1 Tax=Talaromyces marneffei PM1 TaxID=1077442 RepID=A0A093XH78_TALMA
MSRSPSETRSYKRGRSRSRSFTPERGASRSSRRGSGRWPRDRSYSRSLTPESPKRSSKIVVEKLTKNVTEEHLYDIFGTFGEIHSIDLPLNQTFMTNRGTAYILYHDAADAEAAVSNMHEAQIDGAVLKVSIVLPKRMFSRSPPPSRRPGPDDRSISPRRHAPTHEHMTHASPPPRRRSPRRPANGHWRTLHLHDVLEPVHTLDLTRAPHQGDGAHREGVQGIVDAGVQVTVATAQGQAATPIKAAAPAGIDWRGRTTDGDESRFDSIRFDSRAFHQNPML